MDPSEELRKLREEMAAESQAHWRKSESRLKRDLDPHDRDQVLHTMQEAVRRILALEAEVSDLRQRVRELERGSAVDPGTPGFEHG